MAEGDKQPGSSASSPPTQEPVWSYRGYNLRSSEFTTAMVHYYRAEIQRSNTWRTRLDNTTNWAVVTALSSSRRCKRCWAVAFNPWRLTERWDDTFDLRCLTPCHKSPIIGHENDTS